VSTKTIPKNGTPYSVLVDVAHVPPELASAAVPVELVQPDGQVQFGQMKLIEGELIRLEAEGPGSHVVRLELPSGAWIVTSVVVPPTPDTNGQYIGRARLDFGSPQPSFLGAGASAASRPFTFADDMSLDFVAAFVPLLDPDPPWPISHVLRDRRSDQRLPVRRLPSADLESAADVTRWETTFYAFRGVERSSGPLSPVEMLIVAPPLRGRPLTIRKDPRRLNGPPYLASTAVTDPSAHVLFSYLRASLPDRVRMLAENMPPRTTRDLEHALADPIAAMQEAYALLGIGRDRQLPSALEFRRTFDLLPDGAVIAGWHDIRAGHYDRAVAAFDTALARGIPMFSEGLHLLSRGCAYLLGLFEEDQAIARLSARAYRLLAFANLNSELTCLGLSPMNLSIEAAAPPEADAVSSGRLSSSLEPTPLYARDPLTPAQGQSARRRLVDVGLRFVSTALDDDERDRLADWVASQETNQRRRELQKVGAGPVHRLAVPVEGRLGPRSASDQSGALGHRGVAARLLRY
jgi:hypothetical protein